MYQTIENELPKNISFITVLYRDKICEYIQVSGGENQSVELLSLQWNACKWNGHNAIKLLVIEKEKKIK